MRPNNYKKSSQTTFM